MWLPFFFYFEWFFKHTLGVKAVMFFLCIVEYGSIIIILIFLYKFKSFNRIIGKPDESLGRKATGSLKWQPAAWNEVHCLFGSVFLRCYFIDVTIMILSGKNEKNKSMKKAKRWLATVGKKNGGSGPAHWKIKNMENSMISEKPCAGPDVFSWGFSASDKDRFFADFSKNRKTVKKYHT